MTHHLAAFATVRLLRLRARLAEERGQGTVEYVGIVLLVAGVLAAVVLYGKSFSGDEIGKKVTGALKKAISQTSSGEVAE